MPKRASRRKGASCRERQPPRRKPWSGRFSQATSKSVEAYTSSLAADSHYVREDILGSTAHAMMLGRTGIVTRTHSRRMVSGLRRIWRDHRRHGLRLDDSVEDIHMGIEMLLTDLIGTAGERLHSGRSRNDQVALDLRLHARLGTAIAARSSARLSGALLDRASEHLETVMPGYTHFQPAQPVTLAHHLAAHAARTGRDSRRFLHVRSTLNHSPLGAGALAGTHLGIDPVYTARLLGFEAPVDSSMDAVSDRAFLAEAVFASALHMVHLSSIAEELIIWSNPSFGFVHLPESHTTGSSIMPQKRNPDVCELIRAKAAVASGQSGAVLSILKGLPQAYNRDLQELKPILTGSLATTVASADLMREMIEAARFDEARMGQALQEGFLEATDVAESLVVSGVPFRSAHAVVGRAVRLAEEEGVRLWELPREDARDLHPNLPSILAKLRRSGPASLRRSAGGPHPSRVRPVIARLRESVLRSIAEAERHLKKEREIERSLLGR